MAACNLNMSNMFHVTDRDIGIDIKHVKGEWVHYAPTLLHPSGNKKE